ncbi:MAG: hypothetical protein ACE5GX_09030 [Thermoanaerobaculia bacterium]
MAVSPGHVSRIVAVEGRCPTFSWGAVPGATGYELVVYRVSEEGEEAEAVLSQPITGSALGWTPALNHCLERGRRYAWSVRAVGREEASDWSPPSFFRVASGPSAAELEEALGVVREYLAAKDHGATSAKTGTQRESPGETNGRMATEGSPAPLAPPPGTQLSVDGNVNATSYSGDGAMLTNLDPANLSAGTAGINITGTASGLTGTVAITQGGTGATTAPDAIINLGAATTTQLAAHVASADHDGRYYTETEMVTASGGAALHWDNLTAVPPGFADGADADTTYTAGPGLVLNGTQFSSGSASFTPQAKTINTPDSAGRVGFDSSVAVGSDGLPLISYIDFTVAGQLKVAHCDDLRCSSATRTSVDDASGPTSLTIGADGLGLISYHSGGQLKVAHCTDLSCTSATLSVLDTGNVGSRSSITIGVDGKGLISYYDLGSGGHLKVAHCNNIACTSAGLTTLDAGGAVGTRSSIAIGTDGLGLISYQDSSGGLPGNGKLKVAHCNNIACTSATLSILDTPELMRGNSLTIGSDGLGLIAYAGGPIFGPEPLKVAHCNDVACTSAGLTTLNALTSDAISISMGSDALGLILYMNGSILRVAHCNNVACTSVAHEDIANDSWGVTGRASVATGSDGLPIITYVTSTPTEDLAVVHCPNAFCIDYFRRR